MLTLVILSDMLRYTFCIDNKTSFKEEIFHSLFDFVSLNSNFILFFDIIILRSF